MRGEGGERHTQRQREIGKAERQRQSETEGREREAGVRQKTVRQRETGVTDTNMIYIIYCGNGVKGKLIF